MFSGAVTLFRTSAVNFFHAMRARTPRAVTNVIALPPKETHCPTVGTRLRFRRPPTREEPQDHRENPEREGDANQHTDKVESEREPHVRFTVLSELSV